MHLHARLSDQMGVNIQKKIKVSKQLVGSRRDNSQSTSDELREKEQKPLTFLNLTASTN